MTITRRIFGIGPLMVPGSDFVDKIKRKRLELSEQLSDRHEENWLNIGREDPRKMARFEKFEKVSDVFQLLRNLVDTVRVLNTLCRCCLNCAIARVLHTYY